MRKRRVEEGGGKALGGVGPMVEVADCGACESLRACRSCVILPTKTRRRLTTICLVINPNARPARFQRSSRFAVNLKVGKLHLCSAAFNRQGAADLYCTTPTQPGSIPHSNWQIRDTC